MSKEIDFSKMTSKEIEAVLDRKRQEEKKEREKEKQVYEGDRDLLVSELVAEAAAISDKMAEFKNRVIKALEDFRLKAQRYGDIRSNSKGGFSLRNSEGDLKIAYERNTIAEYDERAELAEDLLRDFLGDMVKKRDVKAYEVITSLLERGKKGKFNPAAIAALIKMEDKYEDERWAKAITLFKESYNLRLISMNVSFFAKDELGKDKIIPLSFPSIETEPEETEEDKNKPE